jgi:hypothetical protein
MVVWGTNSVRAIENIEINVITAADLPHDPVALDDAKSKLMDVDYTLPGADETSRNGRPPTVFFHWGDFHSFPSVVYSVVLKFTYFSSAGKPLRAEAHVELYQFEPPARLGHSRLPSSVGSVFGKRIGRPASSRPFAQVCFTNGCPAINLPLTRSSA